jgi:hypothetical protein
MNNTYSLNKTSKEEVKPKTLNTLKKFLPLMKDEKGNII